MQPPFVFHPKPPPQDVWQFVAAKSLMFHTLRVCYTLYSMKGTKKCSTFYLHGTRKGKFMKKNKYLALFEGGEGVIIEKKSRFIATIEPVETVEEAEQFIERMKKKYWDARHNCHAFTVGTDMPLSRCSDDGEPSGTAGKPMLEVLLGKEIHNIAVVVTRYFGGTLLGTGGLVRAYTQAVQAGLSNCRIVEKCKGGLYELDMDYTELGKVQYQLAEQGIHINNTLYEDRVKMEVLIPEGEESLIQKKLIEATFGKIKITEGEKTVFGTVDGEILLFD